MLSPDQNFLSGRTFFEEVQVPEPSLGDMLDDPIIQALMRADRVSRKSIEQLFTNKRPKRKEAA